MKTILVTLYHRRNVLYEEGVSKFLDAGYPLYLYETVDNNSFGTFGIIHDNVIHIEAQPGSFDNGMVDLKDQLSKYEWDTVVFLDSDIFFEDITYAEKLITEFNESDYGFCSYLENAYVYDSKFEFNGLIAEVRHQSFEPVDQPPYTFKPSPHYENAFMLLKRTVWNRMKKENFINTREIIRAIYDLRTKIGVHKREARLTYSHKGDGWFHIGNLTQYYNILDRGDLHLLNLESEVDKARIGFFHYQRHRYGKEIYSEFVNLYLDQAVKLFGGEEVVREAWNKLSI